MRPELEFDVFLCYNRDDQPVVQKIGELLKQAGIVPWLDIWEMKPGLPWEEVLEEQISQIYSAAVFVGDDGVGPWQRMEISALLQEFVNRRLLVIPVLLPDAPKQPALPIFLRNFTWVDFRISAPDPISQLIWGITGVKPTDQVKREGFGASEVIRELRSVKSQSIAEAFEAGIATEPDMIDLLTAIRDTLIEIKQRGLALSDPALKQQADQAVKAFEDTQADFGHKLKLALPIVPGILSYETQLELKGGLNLRKAWQQVLYKIRKVKSD